MINVSPVNTGYRIIKSAPATFSAKPEYTAPFSIKSIPEKDVFNVQNSDADDSKITKIYNEDKKILKKTTVTIEHPVFYFNSNQHVKKKSIKKIRSEAPTKYLKDVYYLLTNTGSSTGAVEGIRFLQESVDKREITKKQAVDLLLDLINCDELRCSLTRYSDFYGYAHMLGESPGYLGAYKKLTQND